MGVTLQDISAQFFSLIFCLQRSRWTYFNIKMADFGELVLVVGDYHIPHRAAGIPVSPFFVIICAYILRNIDAHISLQL